MALPVTHDSGLVIFDCDGVLVDSERLTVRTESAILTRLGWPMSEVEVVERFVGRSAGYMHAEVERHLGRPVDWDREFEAPTRAALEQDLTPVDGIVEALDAITRPTCVASSGSHDKMAFTLGRTGLFDRFAGRIFSVDEVAHGKPAPDIFLHAARGMGVDPIGCVVVEDSPSGVAAGCAAGMRVIAYAGGVTPAHRLASDGVVVIDDMRSLVGLLGAGS